MRDFYFWFIIYKIFLLFQVKVRLLWYFWFIFFFFLKNILFQNIFFFVFILFFILLMLVWEMLNIKTKHILLRFNFFFYFFFNFFGFKCNLKQKPFFYIKKNFFLNFFKHYLALKLLIYLLFGCYKNNFFFFQFLFKRNKLFSVLLTAGA